MYLLCLSGHKWRPVERTDDRASDACLSALWEDTDIGRTDDRRTAHLRREERGELGEPIGA